MFCRLLSCIRFDEVLVLQGSPLIGAIFSMGGLTTEKAAALSLLAAGSCCLVGHVFVLNDWSGASGDLTDPNRATGVFISKGVGHTEIAYLWMALLAVSLLLLSPFGPTTLLIALAIAGVSALYSAPASHMKGAPLLGSALHLVGGLLHFLLGYSLFAGVDARGLEIGCYFGLTFAAGHLTHEARDHDADRSMGSDQRGTFGRTRTFVAGLSLHDCLPLLVLPAGAAPCRACSSSSPRLTPAPYCRPGAARGPHLRYPAAALPHALRGNRLTMVATGRSPTKDGALRVTQWASPVLLC